MTEHLFFACDYMEGAHPAIMQRLIETNLVKTSGYGLDEYCESAKEKIRAACGAHDAEVHFLVGGTQTNAAVIDALLKSYQGHRRRDGSYKHARSRRDRIRRPQGHDASSS